MANKDFRIDLILGAKFAEGFRALDEAKRKLDNVDKAAGKFGAGAGNAVGTGLRVAATTAVAAATAATAVMGLYIARTIEAEEVQAQLKSGIKDTGAVAGRTLAQLNEQAGSLQKITVFDDEAIGNAQAMLLTFTQIRGVNFDRTIEGALDLATKMKVDAADAAKVLGKALSDPEKGLAALTKAGITFTEAERSRIQKMMEAGQVAEAQAAILDKLSGTMGTAAEAARDTLGGAVKALKNSLDNLLEGDSGDEGIVGTRAAIESLIDTLNDPATKQGFDAVVSGMVSVADAAIQVIAKVGEAGSALREYFAENEKKSNAALVNRRTELENELFPLERRAKNTADIIGFGYANRIREIKAELADIDAEETRRNRAAMFSNVKSEVSSTYDKPSNPAPEGQGVASPGKAKGGSKSDPDADIKRRIESLREEAALLGAVKEGEDKASEAAKVRYAITEGEFKNKSPQLKAELLAAAEALDAKNTDIEKEKEREAAIKESRDAYAELMRDLRTPAQVAVDDAIAKLKTLQEAMGRGETGGANIDQAQQRIINGAFERAPDSGFGEYNPLAQIEQSGRELEAWYQSQLAMLTSFRQQRADLNAQWDAQEIQLKAQHDAAMQQLDSARHQMMLGAASSAFGSLAEIVRNGGGEQSKAYRALFALSQGFAVAQALVATYQNAATASKEAGGWPYNIPIIASAIAQGLAIVAQIRSVQPSGYATGGRIVGPGTPTSDSVPIWASRDEHMIRASSATQPGARAFLNAFNERGMDALRDWVGGFAEGGAIGGAARLTPPDYPSYPQGAAGLSANLRNEMSLYLFQDRDALAQAVASHPATRKMVLAEVGENGQAIRASWEG